MKEIYNHKPEKAVTRAIICNDEGKILLGLRARGLGAGQWALVGGKPDDGESSDEAMRREVLEELGVDLENSNLYLEEIDISDPDNPWKVYFYTGTINKPPILKQDEIIEVKYIGESDLDSLDIAFDHKERLKEFFNSSRNSKG